MLPGHTLEILNADKTQLDEIARVIRASIVGLYEPDHGNQQNHLDDWLAARSATKLEPVLFAGDAAAFVCIDHGRLIGVSRITRAGELKLCYVHPQYTGKGVGRLLLEAAEQQARDWGLAQISLTSTQTAKRFYLARGYQPCGEPVACIGMPGYPLCRKLAE